MKLRSCLLVVCWLLGSLTARAQADCPVPTNIKIIQLSATSATLSYQGASPTRSIFGSYSYPGSPKLAIVPAGAGTLMLPTLPPATPITVSLYLLSWSATAKVSNTYSPVVTFTFTTPVALAPQDAPALAALTLAPNPARAATTLYLPPVPGATHATLHLRDVLGREMRTLSAPLGEAVSLNLAGLASGVYLLQAQAGGQDFVSRLVVE
ncbi:MAG: T9SS type A sorting domain-containing protein [Hymenobacter sp.]|nr:MAG: T9SS type A sorting domain-containing protein [Hymenobacter sp.]